MSGTRTARSFTVSEKRQPPRVSVDMSILRDLLQESVTPSECRLVAANEELLLSLPPLQPRTIAIAIKANGNCLATKRSAPEQKSVRSPVKVRPPETTPELLKQLWLRSLVITDNKPCEISLSASLMLVNIFIVLIIEFDLSQIR